MSDQTMERIEKQLEGNSLALSAVAEVLAKMDGRLSRDEEFALAKQEQDEASADRVSLIKEIASEVAGILKDGDAGMDVDGEKVRPAAKTGKTPVNADDAEKPAAIKTSIADQQATIQAMVKQAMAKAADEDEDEEDEPQKAMKYKNVSFKAEDDEKAEEYPVDEKKGGMRYKAEDSEDEDDDDVAKDGEATDEDEDEDDAEKSMMKQLKALKKQVASYEANMQKSIKGETESRLRKMGFREDNGLQRPMRTKVGLGVDGTTPLQKAAAQTDVIDQLVNLSYKELRDMQVSIEAGKTDGLPRELVG